MFPVQFTDGQSLQAIDPNAKMIAYAGHGVVSGCDVSINTGTLGSTEATVTVASGTLLIGGSTSDKTSDTVALDDADPNHPRKDLVVYDPSIPGFTAITGTAEEADPVGSIRQDAERPAPPPLSSSVDAISGTGDPVIPLTEAWIPAGASGITSDDLADRRQEVSPEVSGIEIDDKAGIPVYSDDTNAPSETLYFNSDTSQTKYKDGSGVVHSPARTTLFMSDYVATADRDGSVAVDTEFDAAIADAAPDDTIIFDDGTYQLASSHTILKPLTIDSSDATIEYTNTTNNNAAILFKGGGIVQSTTTSAATDLGQRTIPVTDASIFAVDDRILVIASAYTETVQAHIHFDVVEAVDTTNNEIDIKGGLDRGFASGVEVNHVDLLQAPKMKNITTTGGGNRHLQFRWCEDPLYENVTVTNYLEVSLYTLDCWKARYRDVEATDPEGLASGEGEPIALYRVQDAYIESPRVYDCRRGIDFSRGTRGVTIIDPVIRGIDRNGISVHQNDPADDISIFGGKIVCSKTGATSAGAGITSGDGTSMSIDGTTIVAREDGILATGPTQINNVDIGVVEGNATAARTGIYVLHGDTHITNTKIVDPQGNFDSGVWVDGATGTQMDNFTIDVKTQRDGLNHVLVDASSAGVSNVRISGTLDNLAGTAAQGVLVDASGTTIAEEIDISVNAVGFDEQIIRLLSGGTEQITNVNIHDCYFECGLAAAFSDGTGTFGSIRVSDCSMDTGSTSLSFNETVNKLFIVNNDVSGSIDSTGATSSTVTGNL